MKKPIAPLGRKFNFRTLLLLFTFLNFYVNSHAYVWSQTDLTAEYNECSGIATIKLLSYFHDCGTCDRDWLDYANFFFKNANGNWERFAHVSNDNSCNESSASSIGGHSITWTRSGDCDIQYIEVTIYDLPSAVLNGSNLELRAEGTASDDANPDTVFDWAIPPKSITAAPQPTGLSASDDQCTGIQLNWTNPTNIPACLQPYAKVRVYREGSRIATVNYPMTSYNDTQIGTGNFSYQLQLIYQWNATRIKESTLTGSSEGSRKEVPNIPDNLQASDDRCDGTSYISWEWNFTSPDEFRISRNGVQLDVVGGNARAFTDENINRGQTYNYTIASKNNCGWSGESPIETGFSPVDPDKPADVNTMVVPGVGVRVSWPIPANPQIITGYQIERSLLGGGGSSFFDVHKDSTSYLDESLVQCQTYEYRLRALNECKPDGVLSDSVATTKLVPDLSNTFSTNALIGSKGFYPNRVELNWTVDNNQNFLNGYKIYRKIQGSNEDSTVIASLNSGSNIYIDNLVDAAVLYQYTIVGESQCEAVTEYSNTSSAIGFRSPFGTITGQVTYAGGVAVKDVKIAAESTAQIFGSSLLLNGQSSLSIANNSNLNFTDDLLIEAWLKPTAYDGDFTVAKKTGVWNLFYDDSNSQYTFEVNHPSGPNSIINIPGNLIAVDNYSHLAAQITADSIKLFVNGVKNDSLAVNNPGLINNSNDIEIGTQYQGYLDEMRIWNIGKSNGQIERDYSRIMTGGEAGLIVYTRMNEGVGDFAYDISKAGNNYNRNHAAFVGSIQWTQEIPSSSQLGIVSYTDNVGNYIMTLPYNGIGETFILTPAFQIHVFEPSNQAIYVGDGSFIHNNINFEDKSSFRVQGTVFYDNTTCPAKDVFLKVDGNIIPVNGQAPKTNAMGEFDIRVPIGEHFVSVEKAGHVFSVGRFPASGTFDFQDDKAGINFKDSTLVKVVGRVVGGLREGQKIPGLGKSKNNIGQAQIIFKSQLGNGCSLDTIITSSVTGEYTLELPPLKYLPTVDIINNPAIDFGVLNLVDLSVTPSLQTKYDSIFDSNGMLIGVDSIQFHKQQDYIHRVNPTIIVKDQNGRDDFIGDTTFTFIHAITNDTVFRDIRTNPFQWPILKQGTDSDDYVCLIKVYEEYINFDLSTANPLRDSVPTTDGELSIDNELSSHNARLIKLEGFNDIDSLKFLVYRFKPGTPNFLANTSIPEYSFTRKFEINLITSTGQAIPWLPVASNNVPQGGDQIFRGFLLGTQSNGKQFVTKGPEVVDYVLRDPPGSGSSSTREIGSSQTQLNSWGWDLGAQVNTEDNVHVGAKFSLGLGVSTETAIVNDNTAGFSVEAAGGFQGTQKTVKTSTQSWSTNSGEDQVGAGSDLYIGQSKNMTFGIAEHLSLVPDSLCTSVECLGQSNNGFTFAKKYGLAVIPGGYSTHFIYNQAHIQDYLIPDLLQLRNAYLQSHAKYSSNLPIGNSNYGRNNDDPVFGANVSTTTPNVSEEADVTGVSYTFSGISSPDTIEVDSVRFINNQIKLWEAAIEKNEWEKVNISDQNIYESLKNQELDDLEDEYSKYIALFAVATGNSAVAGLTALATQAINPAPGSSFIGYAVFAVTAASGIQSVELQDKYEEYLSKKDRILQKFGDPNPRNYSISATNSFTASMTHEIASSSTRSFEYSMTASLKNEIANKVSNTGFALKRGIEMSFKNSRDWSSESADTESVIFTLADPDQGDYFSVDVYPSMLGWGPIFKKRAGGATSCPHEPATVTEYYEPGTVISDATLARDKPTISASPFILTNIPSDEAAVFNLTLGNESEAGDPRIYNVSLVSNSNPFGALVSIDGSPPSFSVAIPYGTSINKTISVFKGPGAVYQYDSLRFIITSPCQFAAGTSDNVDIVEEAFVSAHFLPTCTNVSLATPEDQWVLNNSFNDTMPVAIIDYNINLFDLEKLRFDYKSSSEPNWIALETFYKDTVGTNDPDLKPIPLNTPFTLYDWDVSQITDGYYDIRVTSQCLFADRFSVTHSGVMDRINPHPFGNPSPADGILAPNDEISIKFNEPIDLGSLTALNFDIRGVLNGTGNDHTTSLYFDGADDYMEVVGGAPLQDRDFTIEFSARRDGVGEQAVLSQGSDIAESLFIGFNANNNFVVRINGTEIASTTTYADTDWHYFAVSYNFENETAELFVADTNGNGIVNTGNTTIYPNYKGAGRMRIGKNTVTNSEYFQGNLHELRIWSKARTASEFAGNFSKLLSGNEPGLLFNWRMDEAEGIFAKEHVRRRDAAIYGAEWQINPGGNAVSFNGADNYIKLKTGTVNITDGMDYTLEFWFNSTQPGAATLFSNGTGDITAVDSLYSWNIDKDADGKIHVRHYGIDFVAVDSNYFDGEWHHFALILDRASSISAYIDGDLQNSTQALPFQQLGGSNMYLGARGYRTGGAETIENYFSGQMDEFRFWNASRKLEQIRRDKQNRMKGDEFALKLYMPFENFQLDPTGVALLTPTFQEQILDSLVLDNGSTLINQTPTIKLQRPIEAVAFTYSVNEDEIIFTPTTSQELIENVTLDVTVKNVKDLHGNTMESPKTWIAYVDKNQVIWQDDLLAYEKLAGEELEFSSAILNQGGAAKMFDIQNIPDWLTVTPTSGTIAPNSAMAIDFVIDPFTNIGSYFEDIQLITDFNFPENLAINLKVKAEEPDWTVDPADFDNSMGIIGILRIKGVFASDVEDKLAAFHGEEVRGVQNLEYVEAIDAYRVFMDIYSNNNLGDAITFKIWDASGGIIYSKIDPAQITFEANDLIGTVSNPQVFATDTEIKYDIPLNEGWNWVANFLQNADSTNLDVILESLETETGDEIKGLFKFSNFSENNGWSGTLHETGIRPEFLYKLKVANTDTLTIRGDVIDPTTRSIDLVNNWNWIGFISVRNQSIEQAFGNLNASDGDLVKGQSKFAVYDPVLGWIGSLKTLLPGSGYMYKSDGDKSFVYPLSGLYRNDPKPESIIYPSQWQVNYNAEASNMTAIFELEGDCTEKLLNGEFAIGTFDPAEEIAGVATIENVDDVPMNFLTTTGTSGQSLNLKLLDLESQVAYDLGTSIEYYSNAHLGSIVHPNLVTLSDKLCLVMDELEKTNTALFAYPSLFSDHLSVDYYADFEDENARLLLYNNLGQIVFDQKVGVYRGANNYQLSLEKQKLSAGIYYLQIETSSKTESVKLIKGK